MKPAILAMVAICMYCVCFAQKQDEINYSEPFQVDSSEYFLIPRLIDKENQEAYGQGKGYIPWGNYNDIYFYNTRTNTTKKLFDTTVAIINSFQTRSYYAVNPQTQFPNNILPQHIIYLVRTDNFNGDKGLDSQDPVYLYLSSKNGENLSAITPKGIHVISWTASKDKKILFVKGMKDSNNNKKFGVGDDEVYFRVDLDSNIANVKCYPVF